MANGWRTVPFSEVLKVVSRPETLDRDKTYRVLGMRWYAQGLFIREDKPGHEIQANELFRVEKDDFVYNRLFAWKGSFGIVDDTTAGGYVSGEFPCFHVITEKADPKFIHLYLSQEPIWNEIARVSSGQTNISRLRLKVPTFLAMEISLPPLTEQRRIVRRIEALAGRVAEAQSLRREASEEAAKLFSSTAYKVFTGLVERYKPIPIGSTFKFRNDVIHPTDGKVGQLRFIGLQHIESNTGRRIGEDKLYAERMTGRKFVFSPGEIVYGYLRPYLNKVWIADCDGVCSVDQYVIQPKSEIIDAHYLAYFMRSPSFLDKAIELTHSLLLPRLRTGLLSSILIPVPPLEEQRRLVAYLDGLQAQVSQLRLHQEETQKELSALMPSILDKAFKGGL